MKPTFIALLALCLCVTVGCGESKEEKAAKSKAAAEAKAAEDKVAAEAKEESAKLIEAAIRKQIRKPAGELTKADLEKVKGLSLIAVFHGPLTSVKGLEKLTQLDELYLYSNQLTDVKGLEKLTQLKVLYLGVNPDLTIAQINELQKALPKCKIHQNE